LQGSGARREIQAILSWQESSTLAVSGRFPDVLWVGMVAERPLQAIILSNHEARGYRKQQKNPPWKTTTAQKGILPTHLNIRNIFQVSIHFGNLRNIEKEMLPLYEAYSPPGTPAATAARNTVTRGGCPDLEHREQQSAHSHASQGGGSNCSPQRLKNASVDGEMGCTTYPKPQAGS